MVRGAVLERWQELYSMRYGTVMEISNLPCKTWAYGGCLCGIGIKGASSMKLHRDLGVMQKTAWFMLHRIRCGCRSW